MESLCNTILLVLNSWWLTHLLLVLLVVFAFCSAIVTLVRIGNLTKVEVVEAPGKRTFIHYRPRFWQVFITVDPVAICFMHFAAKMGRKLKK